MKNNNNCCIAQNKRSVEPASFSRIRNDMDETINPVKVDPLSGNPEFDNFPQVPKSPRMGAWLLDSEKSQIRHFARKGIPVPLIAKKFGVSLTTAKKYSQ